MKKNLFLLIILLMNISFVFCQSNGAYAGTVWDRSGTLLKSTDGRYTLNLQKDGNLVLYKTGNAIWSSNTNGKSVKKLSFQSDGNLVLYSYSDSIWSSGTHNRNATKIMLQNDGNLVIYNSNDNGIWSTNTQERH